MPGTYTAGAGARYRGDSGSNPLQVHAGKGIWIAHRTVALLRRPLPPRTKLLSIVLRTRCAISGTDAGYALGKRRDGPPEPGLKSALFEGAVRYRPTGALCGVQYWQSVCPTCIAMPGTDLASAPSTIWPSTALRDARY
eukprot:1825620-Rhodomonas_salina.1